MQPGAPRYAQDCAAPLTQVLSDGKATYVYGLDRLTAQTGVSRTWYSASTLGSVVLQSCS